MEDKMQKWEYMTARVVNYRSDIGHSENGTVLAINDRIIGLVKTLSLTGKTQGGESLENFLFRAGVEGWEVVSSNSLGDSYFTLIILKRQKE
jgi:hypothetical protein